MKIEDFKKAEDLLSKINILRQRRAFVNESNCIRFTDSKTNNSKLTLNNIGNTKHLYNDLKELIIKKIEGRIIELEQEFAKL